jgi:protein gp37
MGKSTAIGWCDATWNPWRGCIKVSPGCKHCYMYRDLSSPRLRRLGSPFDVVRSKTTFRDPLTWKDPTVIFTCSYSDFFIKQADGWRPDAWDVIGRTPQHTYLVLTKRPERIADHLPQGWPWPHVWLGVSVETPAYLWRADVLRSVPAAHRFLACEPLLEDLGMINLEHIGWIVTGGESGPERRPMEIVWMASIRDQCKVSGVRLYVKQDVAPKSGQQGRIPDDIWAYKDWPN